LLALDPHKLTAETSWKRALFKDVAAVCAVSDYRFLLCVVSNVITREETCCIILLNWERWQCSANGHTLVIQDDGWLLLAYAGFLTSNQVPDELTRLATCLRQYGWRGERHRRRMILNLNQPNGTTRSVPFPVTFLTHRGLIILMKVDE
jgi:hypothetical protein